MRSLLCSAFVLVSLTGISFAEGLLQTFGSGANAFTIEFVTIGNPGNAADTTGNPNPVGSVAYTYNIGKFEVSRDMVNKANSEGGLGITMYNMTSFGGNGVNRPAVEISWNEAARFVNYLNTSKGYQAAYNFTTSGANADITLWGVGQYTGSNQFRHKNAYYFLPSVDEWYKAAYGNLNGTWNNYATGSDSAPTAVASGTTANTAVYGVQGPADITSAGGLSPWGTMAQGGNVYEWNETAYDGINNIVGESRALRGGSWDNGSSVQIASSRSGVAPLGSTLFNGFRVASVPEPSALSFLAVGLGGLATMRRRRS